MNNKHGSVIVDDAHTTRPEDWEEAVVTRSMDDVRALARRTRGKNKQPAKEQVAVRYSPEVLEYFRSTGKGWQTRMDEALKEYVVRQTAA